MRTYLMEVADLVTQSDSFGMLAHIDYPVRSWPAHLGPFDPAVFEDEFRHALRATSQSGKALEINTVVPLHSVIVKWWHDEGGDAVSFGSDAHEPLGVARRFADAAALAASCGYKPHVDPLDFWRRA